MKIRTCIAAAFLAFTFALQAQVECPIVVLTGPVILPDDQTSCAIAQLEVTGATSETLTSADQFPIVFVNMEHSFMGDLVISLICPNGQAALLHQQGGGGSFLGIPVDVENTPEAPGIGFDYYWDHNSTTGMWSENLGGTLPSDTYTPAESFDSLLGCPVNGTWSIEVCDLWASDNGFLFALGMVLPSDLFGFGCPPAGVGCTDPAACTYFPYGSLITETCVYPGCTVSAASNYDPTAGCDDYGCIFPEGLCDIDFEVYVANPDPPILGVLVDYSEFEEFEVEWQFGDNNSSNELYPYYWYDGDGPYDLCLTAYSLDENNEVFCYDQFCMSIGIEFFQGMGLHSSASRPAGFAINIINTANIVHELNDMHAIPFPNPMIERATVPLGPGIWNAVLNDAHGRPVRHYTDVRSVLFLERGPLSTGQYQLVLTDKEGRHIHHRIAVN